MPVATFTNPHDISTTINSALASSGGSGLQFPQDRPKYYTELSFTKFRSRIGGGTGTQLASGISSALSNATTSFGTPLGLSPETIQSIQNATQQAQQTVTGTSQGTGQGVILPLPVDLFDTHEVKWDEKPILPWGKVADSFSTTLSAGTISSTNVMGLIGLAPNDFQTILFDRPMYKRHELKFRLPPRTVKESDSIRSIITELHNRTAPGVAGSGALFTFPDVVQVKLWPHDGYLYKFKPAIIESVGVNYVGGGVKAFYRTTTAPESVEVTLRIWEIEYWLTKQFTDNDS